MCMLDEEICIECVSLKAAFFKSRHGGVRRTIELAWKNWTVI